MCEKRYVLLNEDEVIKEFDEQLVVDNLCWVKTQHVGYIVNYGEIYRREIPSFLNIIELCKGIASIGTKK